MNRNTSAPHIWTGQFVQSQAVNLAPALVAHIMRQCTDCKHPLKTNRLLRCPAADWAFHLYEIPIQCENLTFRNCLKKKKNRMLLTFIPSVVNKNMTAYDSYRHWAVSSVADNECECSTLFWTRSGKLNNPAKMHQFIYVSLLRIFIMKSTYVSMLVLFIMEDNTTCKTQITRNFTGTLFYCNEIFQFFQYHLSIHFHTPS